MAPLDEIVAFYRFEGDLLDASGNGRSLTLTGASTVDYPAGRIGTGVLPTLGWPRRIGDPALDPASGTISAWVLFQSTSDTIVIGTDDENGNLVSGIKLFDDPPITLAGGGKFYETYDAPANDTWTHFVVSWGGAGFKCWINGVLFTEPVYTFSPGVDGEFGIITQFAQGRVTDLLGVWSRQLTDGEVATLYGGGAGYDPYAPAPSPPVPPRPGRRPPWFRRADAARWFRRHPRRSPVQYDTRPKDSSEIILFIFDFSRFPEAIAGETLSSPTIDASSPSGLTLGSATVTDEDEIVDEHGSVVPAGYGLKVTVSGGTAGTTYSLESRATFSGGSIRVVKGAVACE